NPFSESALRGGKTHVQRVLDLLQKLQIAHCLASVIDFVSKMFRSFSLLGVFSLARGRNAHVHTFLVAPLEPRTGAFWDRCTALLFTPHFGDFTDFIQTQIRFSLAFKLAPQVTPCFIGAGVKMNRPDSCARILDSD